MSVQTELLRTPLHAWHAANSGRMVDFVGWSMPIQYGSIIDEHQATRQAIGMFDVSHMGRFYFRSPTTLELLDRLMTRRVADLKPGKIRYSLVCNQGGGILDDVLVYHIASAGGESFCMMVVNASNREKIAQWLQQHIESLDATGFEDRTQQTAMMAIQGPKALSIVAPLCDEPPDQLGYYSGRVAQVMNYEVLLSRTGYTGEDGVEIIAEAAIAEEIWSEIHRRASEVGGRAAGLGARDTLRLEAAMPLYGHELSESINAGQTNLGFAINLKNRDFVGREAIERASQDKSLATRIGLEMEGRRAAREGAKLLVDGRQVGEVTSGTFSPTLQKPIAMGYVDPQYAAIGTSVEVDVRGKTLPAQVAELPFYKRPA